jgi:transposase
VAGYEPLSRAELVSLLAERDRAVAERDRVITQLRAEAADLAARLERLERLVSRNSGNSSMAPSADDLPGRTPPQPRPKRDKGGGRKPGGQPGSKGSHLAWSQKPDATVPHFPAGRASAARRCRTRLTWAWPRATRSWTSRWSPRR